MTNGSKLGEDFLKRLWAKDATLWKDDAAVGETIANRLGWLDCVRTSREQVPQIESFVSEVREAGYTHAVLLGMGGSSLCPEVFRHTFGVAPGFLDLRVLDSTDPAAVAAVEAGVPLDRTLFLVASKSGTTAETLAFYRYFQERVGRGESFVAITDPGSKLEAIGAEQGFRRVFLNAADIGGRYSALSFFGLVPAGLIGLDLERLLDRAWGEVRNSAKEASVHQCPGVRLGVAMAEAALAGRDKLTLLSSTDIDAFGAWVEQLVAESTGKEGRGVIPIDRELLADVEDYPKDRCFVHLRLSGDELLDSTVAALESAGHPVIRQPLVDPYDLGAQLFRWELATAACSALLGVNPFDEPNVTESKKLTNEALDAFASSGRLPEQSPRAESGDLALHADAALAGADDLAGLFAAHLARVKAGDYLALLAYLPPADDVDAALQKLRHRLRDRLSVATTLGYGPRFQHSSGQLHKGGPDSGVFIQLTCDDPADLPVPGSPYGFSVLKQAQAQGDRAALERCGRRVVRVHLGGKDPAAALERFTSSLDG